MKTSCENGTFSAWDFVTISRALYILYTSFSLRHLWRFLTSSPSCGSKGQHLARPPKDSTTVPTLASVSNIVSNPIIDSVMLYTCRFGLDIVLGAG